MSNEITLKIKGELQEFYKALEKRNFKKTRTFSMSDDFFIPKNLDISKMTTRQILSKAVLTRDIEEPNQKNQKITYKSKQFDEKGNIITQKNINCDIKDIKQAQNLLEAIDYKKIMNIKESDVVYENNGFEILVKEVKNSYNLIEVELPKVEKDIKSEQKDLEQLKERLNEFDLPLDMSNYFVKKAEIELNKILGRKED